MGNINPLIEGFVKGAGLGDWLSGVGKSIIKAPGNIYDWIKGKSEVPTFEASDLIHLKYPENPKSIEIMNKLYGNVDHGNRK